MIVLKTGIASYFSNTCAKKKRLWTIPSIFFLSFLMLFPGLSSFAQSESEYDERTLYLEVQQLGAKEINALVRKNEILLPVRQVFEFYNIWINPSTAFETLSGFIYDRESAYSISWSTNQIRYKGKTYKLKPDDLIYKDTRIFLRAKYYEKIFGLKCTYSVKKQSVKIEPKFEISTMRDLRQEDLRANLSRLTGKDYSDVEVERTYPRFNVGTADWSIRSQQELNGPAETKVNLSLGSVVAGGDFTARLNYNSSEAFRERDQQYLWRFVDNYNTAFSQISLGKIDLLSTSTIEDPVLGIKLSNTPTSFRKSSGTYRYSGKTEPHWIVELYVNNIVVSYAKADGSGSYFFDIPLSYGDTPFKLRFYGPWGEERSREQTFSLPFTFVPKKTLEYDLSAGIVQDSLRSRILRMSANYGISRNVTIGAGYEFFPSVIVSPMMPFVRGSFRPLPNLIFSGELTYRVRAKSTVIFRLPSNIQFDLNYTKYNFRQQALKHDYLQERNVSIQIPVSIFNYPVTNTLTLHNILSGENSLSSGSLITYSLFGDYFDNIPPAWYIEVPRENPDSIETTNYTFAEWLISGAFSGMHANITTTGLFTDDQIPNVYSTLSLSYRFASGLRITPMVKYNYSEMQFQRMKVLLEHSLFKHAYLNMSFEQDLVNNIQHAELGFRYNFNFAQTGISAIQSENRTSFVQYARGSIIGDRNTKYFQADEISNVGKGGITILPFFDENYNGRRDYGEAKISGLNLRTSAGQVERIEEDTSIRILSLEPYTRCLIELDDSGFDNSPLKLVNSSYNVHVDANVFKKIEVPLIIAGKASGTVRINWAGEIKELNGVILLLYDKERKQVGRIFSKTDGSYNFEGLPIGSYLLKIDSIQLQRIGKACVPDSINFQISADSAGLFVTGLDFMLGGSPEPQEILPVEEVTDTIRKPVPEPETPIKRRDSISIKIHELVQEVTDTTDSYSIQLGAFGRESNANAFRKRIAEKLDREVEVVLENGLYKVRILDFESREEVDEFLPELSKNGIEELWVINMKALRQEMMLMTLTDTITEVIEIRTDMPDPSNLNLQLGAFLDPERAEALMFRLMTSLDQPVIILEEDGYSKVRLTGFTQPEQRNAILPELFDLGFTDVWVLPYDTSLYESESSAPEELLAEVVEEQIVEEVIPEEEIAEEVVEEQIVEEVIPEEEIAEEVVEEQIVEEVIPEEEIAEEVVEEQIVEEVIPEEEIAEEVVEEQIVEEVIPEEEIAEEVVEEQIVEEVIPEEEIAEVVVEEQIVEEVIPEEEIAEEVVEEQTVEEVLPKEEMAEVVVDELIIEQPRFSIQAGVFPELSEAKRAQRKILSKLGLESVLVEEFDFTRVLIPGFYTRKETYRYYPELAGLGYDNIMVIEKR